MKKTLIIALALAFAATTVFAAAPEDVKLKAKNGDVAMKHSTHKAVDCATCHGAGTPGKIGALGKDAGHKLCLDCHKAKAAGPAKCGECHKK